MFTGIVEGRRPLAAVEEPPGARVLALDLQDLAEGVGVGDSIAVSGCCLTVSALDGSVARFHVMGETLSLTRFGDLRAGDQLNVERSLRLGDRLGGHLVSGHLDGVGRVSRIVELAGQTDMTVAVPESLRNLMVMKGSISLDGVSLTIAGLSGNEATVCLIPHTLEITTLGLMREGDAIHLEMDQVGKWIRQMVEPHLPR